MLRWYKNFVVFNRKQADADVAAMDIDSALYSGCPTLVGDYYMVTFHTGYSNKTDDEVYAEHLENTEKILDKYKIKYRICKFKD